MTFHRCDGGRGRVTLEKEKPPVMEKIQRNAVPTSSDPFEFQHRMDFPCPFRPTDAAHNHSAPDIACLAVRANRNYQRTLHLSAFKACGFLQQIFRIAVK